MSASSRSERGAGWVWAQFALMAVIVALGAVPPRWPGWVQLLGVALMLAGAAFAVVAGRTLGSSLTPYPRPRPEGELVQDGPFRLVRHPIYAGGLGFFIGYGLLTSVAATVGALALGVLWWFKAGLEERFLAERFPAYAEYRRRVRRRLFLF